jgi:hypothetical protein
MAGWLEFPSREQILEQTSGARSAIVQLNVIA